MTLRQGLWNLVLISAKSNGWQFLKQCVSFDSNYPKSIFDCGARVLNTNPEIWIVRAVWIAICSHSYSLTLRTPYIFVSQVTRFFFTVFCGWFCKIDIIRISLFLESIRMQICKLRAMNYWPSLKAINTFVLEQ